MLTKNQKSLPVSLSFLQKKDCSKDVGNWNSPWGFVVRIISISCVCGNSIPAHILHYNTNICFLQAFVAKNNNNIYQNRINEPKNIILLSIKTYL